LKEKNKKIIALGIVIITLIRCVVSYIQFNYKYNDTSGYKSYIVKILNVEQETKDKKSYLVALEQNNIFADKFILNIYDNGDATFSKGDVLNIIGKINIPQKLGNPRGI